MGKHTSLGSDDSSSRIDIGIRQTPRHPEILRCPHHIPRQPHLHETEEDYQFLHEGDPRNVLAKEGQKRSFGMERIRKKTTKTR